MRSSNPGAFNSRRNVLRPIDCCVHNQMKSRFKRLLIFHIAIDLNETVSFRERNADIIFIDPQTWNTRAIKCYEKSGIASFKVIEKRKQYDAEYMGSLIMCITRQMVELER